MSRRRKQATDYSPPYEIHVEPELDFDAEDVRDADGKRITTESVTATIEHVYAKMKLGRPSLDRGSGRTGRSPQRAVRLPEALDAALTDRAEREGKSISEVMREAVQEYVGRP